MLRRGRRVAHQHVDIGEFSVDRVAIMLRHVSRQERDGRLVLFLGRLEFGECKHGVETVGVDGERLQRADTCV